MYYLKWIVIIFSLSGGNAQTAWFNNLHLKEIPKLSKNQLKIEIINCTLDSLHSQSNYIDLEVLKIENSTIKNYYESIYKLGSMKNLKHLSFSGSNVPTFDLSLLKKLRKLETLNLANNPGIKFENSVDGISALKSLDISNNNLFSFPEKLFNLRNLTDLNLNGNSISLTSAILDKFPLITKVAEINHHQDNVQDSSEKKTEAVQLEKRSGYQITEEENSTNIILYLIGVISVLIIIIILGFIVFIKKYKINKHNISSNLSMEGQANSQDSLLNEE